MSPVVSLQVALRIHTLQSDKTWYKSIMKQSHGSLRNEGSWRSTTG